MPRIRVAPSLLAIMLIVALSLSATAVSAAATPLGRVANGVGVKPDRQAQQWPFLVSLFWAGEKPLRGHTCGGMLIDPQLVLTAAHCVDDFDGDTQLRAAPRTMQVHAGTAKLSDAAQGQQRVVADMFVHPKWNATRFDNDIAVLRLAAPLTLNERVQTIPLIAPEEGAWWGDGAGMEPSVERGPWAAGWGNMKPWKGTRFPNELQEILLPIVPDSACRSVKAPGLGGYLGGMNTKQYLCAGVPDSDRKASNGSTGRDVCSGDSGGPLVVGDGAGQWRAVGIVSSGGECAAAHYSSFTRIVAYREWISSIAAARGTGAGGVTAVRLPRATRVSAQKVKLTWKAPVSGARGYTVYTEDKYGSLVRTGATSRRTITVKPAVKNARVFWVAARSAQGESPLVRVFVRR